MNDRKTSYIICAFFIIILLSLVPLFILKEWQSAIYSSILCILYITPITIVMAFCFIKSPKKDRLIFLLIGFTMFLIVICSIKDLIIISKDIIAGPNVIQLQNCTITSTKNYGKKSHFSTYYLKGVDSRGEEWSLKTDHYSIPKNSTVEIKYFKGSQIVKELEVLK